MPEQSTVPDTAVVDALPAGQEALVEESLVQESLVEEISIDGMCGVY